jgi:hypothetical protein
MVRKYVMLAVISAMIFLALGCQPQKAKPADEKAQNGSTKELWKGYGDYKSSGPKYKNMPPLKK